MIKQTIPDLPKGNYMLTVDMHVSGTMQMSRLGNQRLFANADEVRFADQMTTAGIGDNYPMQTLKLNFAQTKDGVPVEIGVTTDGAPSATWFKIDNFRLYSVDDKDFVPSGVDDVQSDAGIEAIQIFDISGRRINKLSEGINLVRERLSDGTVRVRKVRLGY